MWIRFRHPSPGALSRSRFHLFFFSSSSFSSPPPSPPHSSAPKTPIPPPPPPPLPPPRPRRRQKPPQPPLIITTAPKPPTPNGVLVQILDPELPRPITGARVDAPRGPPAAPAVCVRAVLLQQFRAGREGVVEDCGAGLRR